MNRKIYIWDLDGTILNSYDVIVRSVIETMRGFGVALEYDKVHSYVIKYSVSDCLRAMATNYNLNLMRLKASFNLVSQTHLSEIGLMPNARETLYNLTLSGARHFVYTHRGLSANILLDNFTMSHVFEEIVTSQNGFARKPSPDALNYLITKYHLDKNNTYYVGDRTLDMECAANAGIRGILYLDPQGVGSPSGFETYIVNNLSEITTL